MRPHRGPFNRLETDMPDAADGRNALAVLAARARLMREKTAGPGRPAPYRSFAELANAYGGGATGVRAFETGLGVPGFNAPVDAAPLTPAEAARLQSISPPKPPRPPGPTVGGRGALASLVPRTRGGRQGVLLAGISAIAGGLGLGAVGRATRPEEAVRPEPARPLPPQPNQARESVRRTVLGTAGAAAGSLLSRMAAKYGRRPEGVE